MAQMGILNALITHKSKKREHLLNTTSSTHPSDNLNADSNERLDNVRFAKQEENKLSPQSLTLPNQKQQFSILTTADNDFDDSQWHWQHYHKPYGLKLDKIPLFHDYDNVGNDDDDHNYDDYHNHHFDNQHHRNKPQTPPFDQWWTTKTAFGPVDNDHKNNNNNNSSSSSLAAHFETTINLNLKPHPFANHLLQLMQSKLLAKLLDKNSNNFNNNDHLIHNQNPQRIRLKPFIKLPEPITITPLKLLPPLTTYLQQQQFYSQHLPQTIPITTTKQFNKLQTIGLTNWDHLAQLSCDSGEMIVRLNFTEPFKGIVYPDHNRLSPCRFFGDGHHNYELRLPLRGCGTRQAAPRVFVNDVVVRFHKSLELEEDEVKTLICRYPAPQAPSSGNNFNLNGPFDNQPDQFEFVDTGLGPTTTFTNDNQNPNKNSQTQIETLSDNLVVATPSIIGPSNNNQSIYQQQQPPWLHNQQLPNNSHQFDPAWQLINASNATTTNHQRNSPLIDSSASTNNQNRFMNQPRGFNGATTSSRLPTTLGASSGSLELILLISSIMFLVLLAVAFATSYFCFQKRRHQRRLVSSRTGLAAATAGAGAHYHSSGAPGAPSTSGSSLCGGVATYGPPLKRMQHNINQHHHYLNQATGNNQKPSNLNSFWTPGLDDAAHVERSAASYHHHHPHRYHQQPRNVHHAYWSQDKLKSSTGRAVMRKQQLGRWPNDMQLPNAHLRGQSQFAVPTAHGVSMVGGDVAPTNQASLADRNITNLDHAPAAVADQSVQYAIVEPRHMRARAMPGSEQISWHQFNETTSPSEEDDDDDNGTDDGFGGDAINQATNERSIINDLGRQQSMGRAYQVKPVLINQQQDAARPDVHRRSYNQVRPKQQLQFSEDQEAEYWYQRHHTERHNHHYQEYQQQRVSFAHSHQQRHPKTDGGGTEGGLSISSGGSELHSADCSEEGPATGQSALSPDDESLPPRPSKLIVKSTEDSYIKKFTEIDTQEYMSRDTRQSLGLAEWRSLANSMNHPPNMDNIDFKRARNHDHNRSDQNDSVEARKMARKSTGDNLEDVEDNDEDSWRDSGEASGSNLANQMRSLSEIDISFARSPLPTTSNNTLQKQDHDGLSSTRKQQLHERLNAVESDASTNVKLLMAESVDQKEPIVLDNVEFDGNRDSPDLIVSSEYKIDEDPYNRVRQLQLRSASPSTRHQSGADKSADQHIGTGSKPNRPETPANSVSYV